MKKETQKSIFQYGISIVLLSISLVFLILLSQFLFIPSVYILISLTIYLLFIILLLISMLHSKSSKKIRIGAEIVSIFFILFMILISFALFQTVDLFHILKEKEYQYENYLVLTQKENKANHLADTTEQIGTYVDSFGSYDSALEALKNKVKVKEQTYKTPILLVQSLLDQTESFIFMNESYLPMIREQIENFDDQIKSIGTISIKVKEPDTIKNIDVIQQPFQIYMMGTDTDYSISSRSESPLQILYQVNPSTHHILKITIPSNYYVQLSNTTGYRDHIARASIYGRKTAIQTVEKLLDTDVNYYINIKIPKFLELLNLVNSIEVNSPVAFSKFQIGKNKIDSQNALSFIRTCTDVKCGNNTDAILEGLFQQLKEPKTLLHYVSVVKVLKESIETNIPKKQLEQLLHQQLQDLKSWKIDIVNLDGYGSSNYTYTNPNQKSYVIEPDGKQIEQVKEQMRQR